MTENGKYKIRTAVPDDLDQAAQVELNCFPAAEAADRAALKARLEAFGESFLVAEADGRIIGFINGAVTDEKTIADKMFEDISLHDPDGAFPVSYTHLLCPGARRGSISYWKNMENSGKCGEAGAF